MSVNQYKNGKLNLLAGGSDDIVWTGTKAKFLEEFGNGMIQDGTIVCITDDEEGNEYQQQIDNMGDAMGELQQDMNEINDRLVNENGEEFRYGYQDGKRGVWVKEADTDVFVPFNEEIVEQTVSKTVTYNSSTEVLVSFTFSNLEQVVGVKAFTGGKSGAYFYVAPGSSRPFSISGNTVTVWVVIYSGSATYNITAVGYAK